MLNTCRLSLAFLATIMSFHLHASIFLWQEGAIVPWNMTEGKAADASTYPAPDAWVKHDPENKKIDLGNDHGLIFGLKDEVINADITDSGVEGSGILITGGRITKLIGQNTYRGKTYINSGTLVITNDSNLGAPGYAVHFQNGTLAIAPENGDTIHIARPMLISEGSKAYFNVAENSTVYLNQPIVGENSNGIVKLGAGKLALNSLNTYQGNTIIQEGTLLATSSTLPTDVENNAYLSFLQGAKGSFDNKISGSGQTLVKGPGLLTLTADSSSFSGITLVEEGNLSLQNKLGGHVILNRGHLFGIGTIGGNLIVNADSIISPGNSIGSLSVKGSYTQNSNSTYLVQFNSAGDSTRIDIGSHATLGGNVVVSNADNTFDISKTYTILKADGGIENEFDNAVALPTGEHAPLYKPFLHYDPNAVFMTLNTAIINAAQTYNQSQVAKQLDSIVDPTESQLVILNKMISLSPGPARHALNQMTGQQHSADLLLVELLNRQFIRRLFDPLRDIVGSDPCIREWYEIDECSQGVDFWFEGSGARTSQKGGQNAIGFKVEGGEITFGAQKTFQNAITTGIAASYEYDNIHYHLGGTGCMNSALIGAYGLYRPARYYVLTDLAFSYSSNKIKRPIEVGSLRYHAKSTPNISQVTAYGEIGIDYRWEDLLIQPFLGVEAGNYWRDKVKEHGADDLDLTINSRKRNAINSRLGVHLSAPNLPSDFNLYIDLAWIYRWTKHGNVITEHFNTFGTDMTIQGVQLYHSNFEGTLAITKEICDGWSFFAEFSGEFWKRSCSYYVLGGFERSW